MNNALLDILQGVAALAEIGVLIIAIEVLRHRDRLTKIETILDQVLSRKSEK